MKFIIGSKNKRKIEVTKRVIRELFPDSESTTEGYAAISGVPDTPYDKQTFDGAKNRALDAKNHIPKADYWIGMESGLIERYGHIYEEVWCAVITADGKDFFGYSSGLKVPDYVLKRMDELKKEHSDVMMILEEEHGKLPDDTWSSYSGGLIAREISLEEATRNAFIQIIAPEGSFYRK